MVARIIAATLYLTVCSISAFAQPDTPLWRAVREHDPATGPLFYNLAGPTPQVTLPDLVAQADLVVHGVITDATASLNADQTAIVTNYRVQVFRPLFRRGGQSGINEPIEVQTVGGTTADGGKNGVHAG